MTSDLNKSAQHEAAAHERRGQGVLAALSAAAASATTHASVLASGFKVIAESFAAPFAAVNVRLSSGHLDDYTHHGPADPRFWRSNVSGLMDDAMVTGDVTTRMYQSKQDDQVILLIALPIRLEQAGVCGALGVVLTGIERGASRAIKSELNAAVEYLGVLSDAAAERGRQSQQVTSGSDLDALSEASGSESRHQLAFAITNNLRNRLGCEQVSLGLVTGKSVDVLSISGFDLIKQRNPGVKIIREAMEEAVDRGSPIVCQERKEQWDDTMPSDGHRLNEHWRRQADNVAVASIPLLQNGVCRGVLALRAKPDQSFNADQISRIQKSVSEYIGPMLLVDRAARSLVQHARESARETMRDLVRPRAMVRRALVIFVLGMLGWVVFGSIQHRVPVTCRVIPAEIRHTVAPFDTRIMQVHVAPGDSVAAGQLLYELDARDLILERDRLLAQLAVADVEIDRLTAEGDVVGVQLAMANRTVDEVGLRTINHRIEQTKVRAHSDGVVLEGDLRPMEGRVVVKGEPLLTIAPRDQWRIEFEIPESNIDDVEVGMRARYASDARPDVPVPCQIERIMPRSEVRDGRNVFIAEARPIGENAWVRTGMEGVARIEAGKEPVWWVGGHRFLEYLQRTFWL